jgi:hypothetical protein
MTFGKQAIRRFPPPTRIRRTKAPPSFVGEEAKRRASYSDNLTISWKGSTADLVCRRSRRSWAVDKPRGFVNEPQRLHAT